MAEAISPTTGRRYGVERVCRVWGLARSSFYAARSAGAEERPQRTPGRRGPKPAISDADLFAAIRAGAKGYLLKGTRRRDLLRCIEAVGAGEVIFGPGIAERVTSYFAQASAAPVPDAFPELTAREHEILRLIAAGRENAEIARDLGLSTKTVRNHASNIFMKLQVAHRAQAIVKAREAGLG